MENELRNSDKKNPFEEALDLLKKAFKKDSPEDARYLLKKALSLVLTGLGPLLRTAMSWLFTVVMISVGLIALWIYQSAPEEEPHHWEMLLGGASLVVIGLVNSPFVQLRLGKVGRKINVMLGSIGACTTGYFLFGMMYNEVVFVDNLENYRERTIQQMKDIRKAQEAYFEWYKVENGSEEGAYEKNLEKLVEWIKEPNIKEPYRVGTDHSLDSLSQDSIDFYTINKRRLPSLSEELNISLDSLEELISNDLVQWKIRDTTLVSFYEKEFAPHVREKKFLPLVDLDNLIYSPMSHQIFSIQVSTDSTKIFVCDSLPPVREWHGDKVEVDFIYFGDPELEKATLEGSWRK